MPDDPAIPAPAPAPVDGSPSLLYSIVRDIADLQARVGALERTGSEQAQKTDLRLNAMAGQIAHVAERLDQQDQLAASAQQQLKSQLGTVQGKLDTLLTERAAEAAARDEQRKTAALHFRTLLFLFPPLAASSAAALRLPHLWTLWTLGLSVAVAAGVVVVDHLRATR